MSTSEKPTLLQLRRHHNHRSGQMITSQQLAEMAVIPLADEFQMELGRPVSREVARRVLSAFSALAGHTYTFDDITVLIKEGGMKA